jgi:hypothetical protein
VRRLPVNPFCTHTNEAVATELGKEKSQSLEGLSDKQIEEAVTSLVKNEGA